MTNDFNRRLVAVRKDAQRGISINDMRGVDLAAVYYAGERSFGETRANIGSDIENRYRGIKSALGSIGKGNNRHERSLFSGGRYQRPHAKA